jgi:hypothetical protein
MEGLQSSVISVGTLSKDLLHFYELVEWLDSQRVYQVLMYDEYNQLEILSPFQ